jgi:CubicO group peptidase (beta-lactamase class C family)
LIGPYSFKMTFYDRNRRSVDAARVAGPYGAVVEVTSESGLTLQRYATLFRTVVKVEPGYRFRADAPDELARRAGLDAAVVHREAEVIAAALKERPFAEVTRDPVAARLLVTGTHADAYSVPLDIAKFGQMLLNRGAYGPWRFLREETFEQMLPERLTKVLGPDAEKTFGIGLDGKRENFGHGAAPAAPFSVSRTDDLVVVMTRNKMGRNQQKYNGKFWEALRGGMEKK